MRPPSSPPTQTNSCAHSIYRLTCEQAQSHPPTHMYAHTCTPMPNRTHTNPCPLTPRRECLNTDAHNSQPRPVTSRSHHPQPKPTHARTSICAITSPCCVPRLNPGCSRPNNSRSGTRSTTPTYAPPCPALAFTHAHPRPRPCPLTSEQTRFCMLWNSSESGL